MNKDELQKLVDYCIGFAKVMLGEGGEFFPFGASISKGQLNSVGSFDGDECPSSEKVINDLRNFLRREFSQTLIDGYVIAYDSLSKRNSESAKSDAIAIECYPVDNRRVTYFFPYKIDEYGQLELGDLWQIVND